MRDWDEFLSEKSNRDAVQRFRGAPWQNIRRELTDRFSLAEAKSIEPHWTAPGEAMYWQREVTRDIRGKGDARRWEETNGEWKPVGPLSSLNAAQIAGYLERGLRFRPPGSDAESVDEASETAVAAGDSRDTFPCQHGDSKYVFKTWRAYTRHCNHFNELPKLEIPASVVEHSKTFRWFCFIHNVGWSLLQERAMQQHMKTKSLRTALHPTIPETQTPKEAQHGVPV